MPKKTIKKLELNMKLDSLCPSYVMLIQVRPRKNKEGYTDDGTEFFIDDKDLKKLGLRNHEDSQGKKFKVTIERLD